MVMGIEIVVNVDLEIRWASSGQELSARFENSVCLVLPKDFPAELRMDRMVRYLESEREWRSIRLWDSVVKQMP